MYCSYQWLKEFVDFDYPPEVLAEKLTMLGLEVDSYTTTQKNFQGVVVGRILERLDSTLLRVDIGEKNIDIHSDFSEFENGQLVVIDFNQEKPAIATYRSLDISADDHPIFVGDGCQPGTKISDIIPEIDTVYDIDLTPNRPDCLSIIGIAREISTLSGAPLNVPEISFPEADEAASEYADVTIQAQDGCPRYAARIIKDVTLKPSPLWMHDRLVKAGLRAINNVVDITNYVMIEFGHPLHAFDYALVKGQEIRVRLSEHGEHFITLDGKGHTLDDQTVMICDAQRVIALGGIMGGLNSEVNESTRDLLLECAYFNPDYIRRSSTKLGLSTDASMRFSRGVDPNGVEWAINRTAQFFSQLCDGTVLKGMVDRYSNPVQPGRIKLRSRRVQAVLGTPVSSEEINSIFSRLGCEIDVEKDDQNGFDDFKVTVPTFRPDLQREIDLIEEVCRIVGFDKIPEKFDSKIRLTSGVNSKEKLLDQIREFWTGIGLVEVLCNSMIPLSDVSLQFYENETIKLQNPLSEDMAVLRPSLIPSLMRVAQFNIFRQQETIRMFEIGNTFYEIDEKHQEILMLGGVFSGNSLTEHWTTENSPFNFFNLKGMITGFFQKFAISDFSFEPAPYWALDKPSVEIKIAGESVGVCGAVKEEILNRYDILTPCFIFELKLDEILSNIKTERFLRPVPRFPSVKRDLAFVLDLDIPGGVLLETIKEWGGTYLKDLNIFDIFTGKQVPIGKKSVAVSLMFQADDKTLTESEINEAVDLIIEKTKSTLKAELRS